MSAARCGDGPEPNRRDGELAAAISNSVVDAFPETGRGPTKAKATLGTNAVFVVLQDTLTIGEQTLADAGEGIAVLDLRRRWQRVMQAEMSREIEELTGRKVVGFMSDNHIDPDLAVEVFVLEPLPEPGGGIRPGTKPSTHAGAGCGSDSLCPRLDAPRRRTRITRYRIARIAHVSIGLWQTPTWDERHQQSRLLTSLPLQRAPASQIISATNTTSLPLYELVGPIRIGTEPT